VRGHDSVVLAVLGRGERGQMVFGAGGRVPVNLVGFGSETENK